jgi:hypothetical protein
VWGNDIVWGPARSGTWAAHIVWGTNFVGTSTDGQHIVWGTADQPATTVWGNLADSSTTGATSVMSDDGT